MGWLTIDILVAFLVRYTIVVFKRIRSSWWVANEARVTLAVWRRPSFGCDLSKVQYKYSVEGQEYRSTSVQPFYVIGNPNGPVRVLPPGTTLQIRYDPKDPARSVLVERWWITRRGITV